MTSTNDHAVLPRPQPMFSSALWLAQILLFLVFVGAGVWKLATPVSELAAKMPWMGQVSSSFLRLTALLNVLVGVGALLPSLVRRHRLAALGALGCAGLMTGAIVFHFSRGEEASTPFNFLVATLAAFVVSGRSTRRGSRS